MDPGSGAGAMTFGSAQDRAQSERTSLWKASKRPGPRSDPRRAAVFVLGFPVPQLASSSSRPRQPTPGARLHNPRGTLQPELGPAPAGRLRNRAIDKPRPARDRPRPCSPPGRTHKRAFPCQEVAMLRSKFSIWCNTTLPDTSNSPPSSSMASSPASDLLQRSYMTSAGARNSAAKALERAWRSL